MNKKILCIGQLGWDITNILGVTRKSFGGSALHFSLSAAIFGVKFEILSYVNFDEWDSIIKNFQVLGIGIKNIINYPETIGFKMFYNNDLVFIPDKFELVKSINEPNLTNIFSKSVDKYHIIHMCPIPGQDFKYFELVRKMNTDTIMSFQVHILALKNNFEEYLNIFKLVDILFMNQEEAIYITQQPDLDLAVKKLQADREKIYVITTHEQNIAINKGKVFMCNCLKSNVVDPTGAGDAFAGGFMAGYIFYKDLQIALRFGTIAATIKLSSYSSDALLNFLI